MNDQEVRRLLNNAKKVFEQAMNEGNAELAIDAAAQFETVCAWTLAKRAREFAERVMPQKEAEHG